MNPPRHGTPDTSIVRIGAASDSASSAAAIPAVSTDPTAHPISFASDNWSGAHPEVIAAIAEANVGHTPGYGGDPWTERFAQIAREHFGPNTEAYPVFNGTGANVLALQAALPRWGAVICAQTAHINNDETGAPEKTGGLKLLPIATPDGKLTPELVLREAHGWGNIHRAQPLAISISQTTEWGTCYSLDEVAALAELAHSHGMFLHIDGSRLGNAAAHLGVTFAELAAGADILSLGGSKNGLLGAEAVIVLNPEAAHGIEYLRKTVLQLGSKMRFISAQLNALYEADLWLRSAQHSNEMANRLASGLEKIITEQTGRASSTVGLNRTAVDAPLSTQNAGGGSGSPLRIVQPVQSNAVFVAMSTAVAAHARKQFAFGDWKVGGAGLPEGETIARLMCAFDTSASDVDALVAAIAEGCSSEHSMST